MAKNLGSPAQFDGASYRDTAIAVLGREKVDRCKGLRFRHHIPLL
jgi:hypothetical protein